MLREIILLHVHFIVLPYCVFCDEGRVEKTLQTLQQKKISYFPFIVLQFLQSEYACVDHAKIYK